MKQWTGERITEVVDGLVHAETQVGERAVVLTADTVERITSMPAFDFGGSEYAEAGTDVVEPVKRDDGDDYGWWELDEGAYVVRLNESVRLPEDLTGVLQGWWRLTANGVQQPTQVLHGDHPSLHQLIRIPATGARIKENARISELRVFE